MNRGTIRFRLHQADPAYLWLFAGLLLAVAPHFSRLPLMITLPSCIFLGWRLLYDLKLAALPSRLVRWLLTLIALGATLISFHTIVGRQAGVSLLVVMLGLKLMEMDSRRDTTIVLGLGYFITLTVFMFDQSMFIGLYMVVVVMLLTTAQLGMNIDPQAQPQHMRLRNAGRILGQAAPLALILFVLFPRIPGPLWNLPNDSFSASTGLSDSMSPGNITRLSDNSAVAFRVLFDDPLPPPAQRYWRGPVFMEFDGRSWRNPFTDSLQDNNRARRPLNLVNQVDFQARGEAVRYRVTLEPHQRHWLFALDLPGRLPADSWLTSDVQLIASKPVSQLTQYRLLSYPDYTLQANDPPPISRYLQLPSNAGPRARELAQSFRQRDGAATAIVQQALDYFREQPFYYTRRPPLLPDDPIDQFLFDSRRGYCEHYASTFTFLMRAAGIPARVVTGYQGGEMNPLDDYFIVRQSDAHAWAEVWIAGQGWIRIDPTAVIPASRIEDRADLARIAPDAALQRPLPGWTTRLWRQLGFRWDSLNHYWNQWVINYNQRLQRDFLSRLGLGDIDWRGMVVLLMTGVGLVLGFLTLRMLYLRPRSRDPVIAAYTRFCRKLARRGIEKGGAEGPLDFSRRARAALPADSAAIVQITSLYQRLRYAPQPPADGVRRLKQAVAQFRA